MATPAQADKPALAYADALKAAQGGAKIRCERHQLGWLIEWSTQTKSLVLVNPFSKKTYPYVVTATEQGLKWETVS